MDKPIAFYPQLARELGSVTAAIYYQQIYYWSSKGKRDDGFIYKSAKEIEEETTITEKQQRLARKVLKEKGWIEMKKMQANGAPTWHFKPLITIEVVMAKGQIEPAKRPNRTSKKASSITETTTETTTDNSKELGRAYGNKDINILIDALKNEMGGVPMDGTQKENRRYAKLFLNKLEKVCEEQGHNKERAPNLGCYIIKSAHEGWHAKNATSMKYIYYNMGKIVNENKQNKPKDLSNKIIS